MKRRLLRYLIVCLLVGVCAVDCSATNAAAKQAGGKKQSAPSDLPLTFFQQIDQRLSRLDADNQALQRKRLGDDPGHGRSDRMRVLRSIQRSQEFRERSRTINQLLAITARAERSCAAHRQRYGARLFRDLNTRFTAMKAPMVRSASARTLAVFDRDQKTIQSRMLPAIVQYQAISGGYAGLACRPGSRACCQSRLVGRGRLAVRGCTWSCTSRPQTSTNVFLGPLIPKSVVTVKNAVPEHQNRTPKTIVTARNSRKKSVERATTPGNRQSAPAGSE